MFSIYIYLYDANRPKWIYFAKNFHQFFFCLFKNILHLFLLKKNYFGCRQVVDPPPRLRTCPQLSVFYAFPYIKTTRRFPWLRDRWVCNGHRPQSSPKLKKYLVVRLSLLMLLSILSQLSWIPADPHVKLESDEGDVNPSVLGLPH